MKKILAFISMCLLLSSSWANDSINVLMEEANTHYQQGEYEKAVAGYEMILVNGVEAPGLYYNLGNAYFKSNKLARAILNYERALQLDPADKDARYNLELARTYMVDRIEKLPEIFYLRWWKEFMNILPGRTWAIMSIVFFVLFLASFAFYLFSGKLPVKRISFIAAILLFVFSITSFGIASSHHHDLVSKNAAIIMASSVTVKSSPDTAGNDLFVLHEGTKVYVEDTLGEWYEIRIDDGNKGWIRKDELEII